MEDGYELEERNDEEAALLGSDEVLSDGASSARSNTRRVALAGGILLSVVLVCALATFGLQSYLHGWSKCGRLHAHRPALVTSASGSRHAISVLMCQAKEQWDAKVARQSKTLQQAVAEYKRRYRRAPPKGFDGWFTWAQQHGVVLIDEYDLIYEHIGPFFAFPPYMLRAEMEQLHRRLSWATGMFKIEGGYMFYDDVINTGHWALIMRDFLAPIEALLPDVTVLVNIADEPRLVFEDDIRSQYIRLARQGNFTEGPLAIPHSPDEHFSYRWACPRDSPVRKDEMPLSKPDFAFLGLDGKEAINPCFDPAIAHEHGLFLDAPNADFILGCHKRDTCAGRPVPFAPMLSFSGSAVTADIQVPTSDFSDWVNNERPDDPISFADKKVSKAGWHGNTFGQANVPELDWKHGQRPRLHMLTHNDWASEVPVRYWDDAAAAPVDRIIGLQELGDCYLDVSVVNQTLQCSIHCEEMQEWLNQVGAIPFADYKSLDQYKAVIDVDGNGWSGRFKRLLHSNAMVLKSTMIEHWFRDRIQPWLHYVPLRVDYADIYDIMAYYFGDEEGRYSHVKEAEKIAYAGQDWADKHMRTEDSQAYCACITEELESRAELFDSVPPVSRAGSGVVCVQTLLLKRKLGSHRTADDREIMNLQ